MNKSADINKIEARAKRIVQKSKVNVEYFKDTDEENKKSILLDVQETYKDIPSIYNQNTNLSPRNMVLRSLIINMFNYNFWGENEVLPNSSVLLDVIYTAFNSNKTLDLFYGSIKDRRKFIKKLKESMHSQKFKCKDSYISDIYKLEEIIRSSHRHKLYSFISKVIQGNISIQEHIKILGKIWPSYGKDIFFKREILAWYFIKDVIPNTVLKRIPNEELYFPIDYRLPSALNHMNFMNFPKRFKKYFNGSKILKNKKDEKLIRAVSFLTLINLNRCLKLDAHKLDYYFFSKSRTLLKSKHLKFQTTDY